MNRAGHDESSPNHSLWLWVPNLRFACPGRQRRLQLHPALLEISKIVRDGGDFLIAHVIGDIGHRGAAAADALAALVIVQRLDEIFLALAREPRHSLGAGEAIGMT